MSSICSPVFCTPLAVVRLCDDRSWRLDAGAPSSIIRILVSSSASAAFAELFVRLESSSMNSSLSHNTIAQTVNRNISYCRERNCDITQCGNSWGLVGSTSTRFLHSSKPNINLFIYLEDQMITPADRCVLCAVLSTCNVILLIAALDSAVYYLMRFILCTQHYELLILLVRFCTLFPNNYS